MFLIMLVSLYCITGLFKIENTKWRYIGIASLAVLFGLRFYREGLYLVADSFLLKGFIFLFFGLAVAALIFRFLAYLGSRLFS